MLSALWPLVQRGLVLFLMIPTYDKTIDHANECIL
jgi:hypothetical protein